MRKPLGFEAEVAAAAAAAIERPAQVKRPGQPDFHDLIHKAQAEAERRRHLSMPVAPADIQSAQFEAAARRSQGEDLKQTILNAQRQNAVPQAARNASSWPEPGHGNSVGWGGTSYGQRPMGNSGCAAGPSSDWQTAPAQPPRPRGIVGEPLSYEDFLGNWADLQGNPVLVYSTDAWQPRLMAAVTRPNRPDLQLSLRGSPGGGWICGNATLDTSISSAKRLHWIAPDGRVSVWTRGRE